MLLVISRAKGLGEIEVEEIIIPLFTTAHTMGI